MTEAEILHQLRPGAWIGRQQRKALELMLASARAGSAAHSPSPAMTAPQARASASGETYGHLRLEGCPAFRAATRKALDALKRVPSWRWTAYLNCIREAPVNDPDVGGYYSNGVHTVMRQRWQGSSAIEYGSTIAHEGVHGSRGGRAGTEEERIAFQHQVQALKEMGAPWSIIRVYERHATNPTHHLTWNGPRA